MAQFINCSISKFKQFTAERKIYLYGAGRRCRKFLDEIPDLQIEAVIDTAKAAENTRFIYHGCEYRLITFEQALQECHAGCDIVITIMAYDEAETLINASPELEYISYFIYTKMREWRAENYAEQNRHNRIKRYQIVEDNGNSFNAGTKAPEDIIQIAGEDGYQIIQVHMFSDTRSDWQAALSSIQPSSYLLLQLPLKNPQYTEDCIHVITKLKEQKEIKLIVLFHDIESLRPIDFHTERLFAEQFFVKESDVIILHNQRMIDYLVKTDGAAQEKLLDLEIFDYLFHDKNTASPRSNEMGKNNVIIAGNLSSEKNTYFLKLRETGIRRLYLYGSGGGSYLDEADNITYCGAYPPERLISVIVEGWGLIWGGDSITTCNGKEGEYLRYNNPHKLSFYLAAGMPVIIWEKAAQAAFVQKYNVGITVSSLFEVQQKIDTLSREEYLIKCRNAQEISTKLSAGYYMKHALYEAEEKLKDCEACKGGKVHF